MANLTKMAYLAKMANLAKKIVAKNLPCVWKIFKLDARSESPWRLAILTKMANL